MILARFVQYSKQIPVSGEQSEQNEQINLFPTGFRAEFAIADFVSE